MLSNPYKNTNKLYLVIINKNFYFLWFIFIPLPFILYELIEFLCKNPARFTVVKGCRKGEGRVDDHACPHFRSVWMEIKENGWSNHRFEGKSLVWDGISYKTCLLIFLYFPTHFREILTSMFDMLILKVISSSKWWGLGYGQGLRGKG